MSVLGCFCVLVCQKSRIISFPQILYCFLHFSINLFISLNKVLRLTFPLFSFLFASLYILCTYCVYVCVCVSVCVCVCVCESVCMRGCRSVHVCGCRYGVAEIPNIRSIFLRFKKKTGQVS